MFKKAISMSRFVSNEIHRLPLCPQILKSKLIIGNGFRWFRVIPADSVVSESFSRLVWGFTLMDRWRPWLARRWLAHRQTFAPLECLRSRSPSWLHCGNSLALAIGRPVRLFSFVAQIFCSPNYSGRKCGHLSVTNRIAFFSFDGSWTRF